MKPKAELSKHSAKWIWKTVTTLRALAFDKAVYYWRQGCAIIINNKWHWVICLLLFIWKYSDINYNQTVTQICTYMTIHFGIKIL